MWVCEITARAEFEMSYTYAFLMGGALVIYHAYNYNVRSMLFEASGAEALSLWRRVFSKLVGMIHFEYFSLVFFT